MAEKYSNGKIYRIVDNTTGNCYIGSTFRTLEQRLKKHEVDYKMYLNGRYTYVTSFDIIKNGDYNIELVEDVRAIDKKDLLARERYHIENSQNTVNKQKRLNRTRDEYLQYMKENSKKHYVNNRDKEIKNAKDYYLKNREYINKKFKCKCGGCFTKINKTHHFKTSQHKKYLKKKIIY